MNPQPDPIIGNIGAFIFIALLIVFTFKAYISADHKISLDKYVIGYIDDYVEVVPQPKIIKTKVVKTPAPRKTKINTTPVKTPVSKVTNESPVITKPVQPKTEQPVKPKIDEALYNDCINVLTFLGYKKKEANIITKQIFNLHQINSIQDFIKFVTVKDNNFYT